MQNSLWRGNKKSQSRKDVRKQERQDRKKRKADHFLTQVKPTKRVVEEEHDESQKPKRRKTVHFAQDVQIRVLPSSDRPPSNSRSLKPSQSDKKPKPKTSKGHGSDVSSVARKSQIQKEALLAPKSRQEEDDDACIAYYEGKLGYRAGKRKESDGLDGLDGKFGFNRDRSYDHSLYHLVQTCWISQIR